MISNEIRDAGRTALIPFHWNPLPEFLMPDRKEKARQRKGGFTSLDIKATAFGVWASGLRNAVQRGLASIGQADAEAVRDDAYGLPRSADYGSNARRR